MSAIYYNKGLKKFAGRLKQNKMPNIQKTTDYNFTSKKMLGINKQRFSYLETYYDF